ncbi:MAG: Phosphoserine phosphatase RsbU, partial [Pseudomonadota bacterium]
DSCPTEAGLCYLVTGNGLFLGTSHPHLVTEKTFAERETLIKAVKGGLRGGFRFVNTAGSNQEAAVTYQEAENTNVYIFIETTTTSIVKQAEQFLRRILILGILLVVVMSFALSKIISTILAPITSLKRSFNRIRKGEYQVDINHKYADEFSIMIQDAKVMADTLKERESTILRVQDNLQEILTLTRDLALAETLEQIFTTVLRGIGKNLDITQTAVAGIHLEDELREVTHLEDFSSVSLKPDAKANPTIERALKNTIERLLPRARVEIYVSGPTILIPILSAEGKKFCTLAILNAASLYPTNENLHYIRTLAGSISRLVENILQQIKLKSLSSIESEMKSAASLQSTFLADVPAITDWKFSSFFKPASRVGGDWYAFHNDEGSGVLFLAIGDATGHGLSSALVSVIACSAFHSFLETKIANDMINFSNCDATVTELLDNMDTVIVRASEEKVLMTCILLAIQTATGQVILINGGHRPPIVRRSSGETNAILAKGDILGLKNQKERKCEHLTLQHGDSLVLYSDGLIENTGPKNQIFSGQKLRAAIRADINSANHLLDNIVNAAKSIWEDETAADDVTVISVTRDHPV